LNLLQQKEIPEHWPEVVSTEPLQLKEELVGRCGYCLLSYDWIRPLAAWIGQRRCLEIMCGSGALSRALQNCGVQIKATDDYSWSAEHAVSWFADTWTMVEQMDAQTAIATYGCAVEIVVCCWPYRSEACTQALLQLRQVNPKALFLYIGEGPGGATASDSFFATAVPVMDTAFVQAVQAFQSIYGNSDRPCLIR